MRIVLMVIGALVILIGAMAAIGALLPANHRARRSATVKADRAAVWAAITDVNGFPSWRPDVKKVTLLPSEGGRRRWVEEGRNGKITFEIVEERPPELLVSRIADPNLPFGGTWTYELAPAGDGTSVTVTEDGVVRNVIFRFMSRYVFGHTATLDAYLAALARKLG